MNTDQAFDLLRDAGVTEEVGILTVRRWLRERKINYQGIGNPKTGYILDNTDQALDLLSDAGVVASKGIQVVRRWMKEGKIRHVSNGERLSEYISNETHEKQSISTPSDQKNILRQLKLKIKVQEDHIKGVEELHKTSIHTLVQQIEKLKKQIIKIEKDNSELQTETKKLLQENIELRRELLKLKEELSKGGRREPDETEGTLRISITNDYRQKLGLSKNANPKEIVAGYKHLLKVTHPDHGGNAAAFHYIKTEFDYFRKSLKG